MLDRKKIALALGHFDGVHKGHAKVISKCVEQARKHGLTSVAITFDGDLKGFLNHSNYSVVDTATEREIKLKSLGIDTVWGLKVNKGTLSMPKEKFLEMLYEKYDIKVFVCGLDFRFGLNAGGDINFLREYGAARGSKVVAVKTKKRALKKISTSTVKELLTNGKIEKANLLLGAPYQITGKVVSGRRIGHELGFPTANVSVASEKTPLKQGVYFATVTLDKEYRAIVNYGARPSFGLYDAVMEVHLLDFSGDLYGKELTVKFVKYLRNIIKFSDKTGLTNQLEKDRERAKRIKL